jgi:hypothetical protein
MRVMSVRVPSVAGVMRMRGVVVRALRGAVRLRRVVVIVVLVSGIGHRLSCSDGRVWTFT